MKSADEIKRLRATVERLNDEANFLAIVLALILAFLTALLRKKRQRC